jgi:cytochrome o ubiquinol oxidase subunit 1
VIGFYLAFMPLYALGFMGMPRRMEHYDTAAWQPWLITAAVGAVFVLAALVCLGVQITVSVRNRARLRDDTGDPWDGPSLEWLTASPPPPYNFAIIPDVRARDAFRDMKLRNVAGDPPGRYEDIAMPRPGAFGLAVGAFAFALGFGMVWHLWWLAGLGAALIVAAIILRSSDDDTEETLFAAEVERIESGRLRRDPAT